MSEILDLLRKYEIEVKKDSADLLVCNLNNKIALVDAANNEIYFEEKTYNLKEAKKIITDFKENELKRHRIDFIEKKEPRVICKKYLPLAQNTVNMIASFGGLGKSWLALNEMLHAAADGLKTMYYTNEDSVEYLAYRTYLLKPFYRNFNTIIKNVYIKYTNEIDYKEKYFDLVIYDPLLSYFNGSNENDNKQARDFISSIISYANDTQTTVLLLHHTGKNFDAEVKARGASAFIDSTRTLYEIEHISKESKKTEDKREYNISTSRKILLKKDNLGISKYVKNFELILKIKPKMKDELILDENTNGGYKYDREEA